MLAFLTSKWGLLLIGVLAAVVAVVWWTLHVEAAATAAAIGAAAIEAMRRVQAANRARAEVDQSPDAIKNDRWNRD